MKVSLLGMGIFCLATVIGCFHEDNASTSPENTAEEPQLSLYRIEIKSIAPP